jgi:hypothetical protein
VSRSPVFPLFLALVLVAACQPAADAPERPADAPAQPAAPAFAPEPGAMVAPDQPQEGVPFEARGGSGITGRAIVTRSDGRARINIAVQGAPPEMRLQALILNGTCDQPGGGTVDVDLFFADEQGMAVTEVEAIVPPPGPGGQILILLDPHTTADQMLACAVLGG